MPTLDECSEELLGLYGRLRLYRFSATLEKRPSELEGGSRELALIVKSVHEPSVDEVPLLDAIMSSLEFSEVYEYERVAEGPEGSRAEHLAEFLSEALADGKGVVLIMPNLMAASLTSRLSDEVLDILDRSAFVNVDVGVDNVLYLPLREVLGESQVEIVAKANSRSSYERVEWLRGEATRRGIRIEGVRYLEDNKSITEYVTSIGARGYMYRVPVTKLAMILISLDRCTKGDMLEEIRRPESSAHTIYIINVRPEDAGRLTSGLASVRVKGAPLLRVSERLRPFMEKGSREAVAEVARRLGLI